MKMLRCICNMDHEGSLRAVLQVIECLEHNIFIDDNITNEKYVIIKEFLEEQYIETRIQLMEERMKEEHKYDSI